MRRQSRHIHELPDWPNFGWDQSLASVLATVRHQQGRLIGRMEGLGFQLQQEAVLQTLTEDVVKSSEIEGEMLNDGSSRPAAFRRREIPQRRRDRVERRAQHSPLLVKVVKQFTCPRVHAPLYRTLTAHSMTLSLP